MSQFHVVPSQGVAGRLTVPGDKSISHRALMLGAIARARRRSRGFSRARIASRRSRPFSSLGVDRASPGARPRCVDGVGLTGLRAPGVPLDMGNAGTAMRLFMGLLAPQAFDSVLIGDGSLMQRPMERVAAPLRAMGARITTRRGTAAGANRRRRALARASTTPCRGGQRASEVGPAARGAQCRGAHDGDRADGTRDHTERMLRSFGCAAHQPRRSDDAATARRGCGPRGFIVPADFSSAAFFLVAGCLAGARAAHHRRTSESIRRATVSRDAARDGRRPALLNQRNYGAEPVADIEVRPARLHGIDAPARLVPLAIDEFPVLFIAAACASGRDDRERCGRAAGQGNRPDRRHGAGARRARHPRRESAGRGPDRRGQLTGGDSRQPRRSPRRDGVCGRGASRSGPIEIREVDQRRDLVSRFRGDRPLRRRRDGSQPMSNDGSGPAPTLQATGSEPIGGHDRRA